MNIELGFSGTYNVSRTVGCRSFCFHNNGSVFIHKQEKDSIRMVWERHFHFYHDVEAERNYFSIQNGPSQSNDYTLF